MGSHSVSVVDVPYYPVDRAIPEKWNGSAYAAFPANEGPRLNLYLGRRAFRGAAILQREGVPTLLRYSGGGYTTSVRLSGTLSSAIGVDYRDRLCAAWLDRGGHVLSISVCPGISGSTPPYRKYRVNTRETVGNHFPPDEAPAGLGLVPYGHLEYPMAMIDAVLALQFVKQNPAAGGAIIPAGAPPIDLENLFVFGDSFAAHCAQFASFIDHATELGSGATDPMYSQNTVVRGAFLDRPIVAWECFLGTKTGRCFPDKDNPDAGNWTTPAFTLSEAPTAYTGPFAPFGLAGGYASASNQLANMLIYISSGVAESTEGAASGSNAANLDPPFGGSLVAAEGLHSVWNSDVLARWMRQNSDRPVRMAVGSNSPTVSPTAIKPDFVHDAATSVEVGNKLLRDWTAWMDRHIFNSRAPRVYPWRGTQGLRGRPRKAG